MISYEPLFNTLKLKKMSLSDLKKQVGISTVTLAKFRKYESVNLSIINRICLTLNCNINDVVEITDGYMYYI